MKLVDILAVNLKCWPETTLLAQDSNGHVFGWTGFPSWDGDQWLIDAGASLDKCRPGEMDLADDHMTASVTRAEWQGAVDAQKAEKDAEVKWPNAATHYKPSMGAGKNPVFYHVLDGRALYAWAVLSSGKLMDCPTNNPYGWDFDYSTAIPRPVESAADQINAPKVVEWPELSETVEVIKGPAEWNDEQIGMIGRKGKVRSIFKNDCDQKIVAIELSSGECKCFIVECIKPVRTDEQEDAEGREKAAEALYMDVMDHKTRYWPTVANKLKDHYRGLVDAGWKKVAK